MSFDIRFERERTTDGCTFIDFHFDAPSHQEPIYIHDEVCQMTVSGRDSGFLYGSDLLGWDVVLGPRITPDQLEGIEIPGVTFRTRASGGISGFDFPNQVAARAFITHIYEAFYEAFYLGFDTYTLDEAPTADTVVPVQQLTDSPRSVPAPSARNVVPSPVPASTGTAYRAAFYGTAVTPHLFKRNTQ